MNSGGAAISADDLKRDERAGTIHLAAEQARRVLPGEPGIVHALDGRMRGQALREIAGGRLLGANPDRHRADAAVQQVRLERTEQPAGESANLPQAGHPLAVRGDDPAHRVAVAADVLRRAVQHERRAVLDRSLQDGSRKRVVDEHRHIAGLVDDPSDVDHHSVGFAGVSMMTSPVSGRIAAATPSPRTS